MNWNCPGYMIILPICPHSSLAQRPSINPTEFRFMLAFRSYISSLCLMHTLLLIRATHWPLNMTHASHMPVFMFCFPEILAFNLAPQPYSFKNWNHKWPSMKSPLILFLHLSWSTLHFLLCRILFPLLALSKMPNSGCTWLHSRPALCLGSCLQCGLALKDELGQSDVLSWEFELWNTERLEQLAEVM